MVPSPLVCRRCGLPVRGWGNSKGETYWKHSAGWHTKSCGKPPVPVRRSEVEGTPS